MIFIGLEDMRNAGERTRYLNKELAWSYVSRIRVLAAEAGLSVGALAMAYVRDAYPDASVLLGLESCEQARENLDQWVWAEISEKVFKAIRDEFGNVEENVIDPPRWAP